MKPMLLLVGMLATRAAAQDASPALPPALTLPPTPEVPTAQSAAQSAREFDWKIRPAVGSRWMMRSFQRTQMNFKMPSATPRQPKMNLAVSSVQRFTADYEVLSRDDMGATTVRLTYREFDSSANTSINGKVVKTPINNPASEINRSFIGAALTMKMAPNGQVWSIQGLDALNRRITAAVGRTSPQSAGAMAQVMGNFLSEKTFKQMYSQNIGALPPHPLWVGDKYPYKIDFPFNMGAVNIGLKMNGERQLSARKDGIATIKESGTLDMDFGAAQNTNFQSGKTAAPPFKMKMKGEIKGGSLVDEASGLTREINLDMTLHGNIALPPNARAPKNAPSSLPLSGRIASRIVMEPVTSGVDDGSVIPQPVPTADAVRNVAPFLP